MEIKRECGFNELQETCWSGAVDTLNTISKHDKEDEFMQYLEEVFSDDIPTETEVNDFIWFNLSDIMHLYDEDNEDDNDDDDDEEYEEDEE